MASDSIGYYALPVLPSFEGMDKQINAQMSKSFGGIGKKLGVDMSRGAGAGIKSLEAEVAVAAKAYDRLKDKASDALGKVRAEEAKLERLRTSGASNDRIVVAEERLATARRASARASRESEDSHRSLSASQAALASGTDDLGGKLGGLATLAARVGPAIGTVGVAAAGAAVGGIALLAAGAVKATSELYQLGAQFDETFDSLRIQTGATGPQLQALEEATKRISGGVPLAISDIGQVVGETSRALHLTGTDLDNVSKNIANLGRLTGENVDVRTLGKAFRGFGVEAKDQVPALDSLFRASQTTGVGVNELLATVVKGGAGLRQFGFDFGQSAALATQFEESGLDADKAMAGLTRGLASLAKNGQTGQQALRDNVTGIKNLIAAGDDAGALDLTNKLFGERGGVQFFEAIKNGALDLDTLSGALDNTGDTIQAAADDTDDFEQKWQQVKNTISAGLQPLASGLFDSVNAELGGITDTIREHQPQIIGFFSELINVTLTAAQGVTKAVGLTLNSFGEFVGGFGNVVGAIYKADAAINDLFGNHDRADEERRLAEEAYGWGEGLKSAGNALVDISAGGMEDFKNKVADYGKNAAEASKFTVALGKATAALPDGKTITISDNSPETVARLRALGIEVQETPNGITVTATTDEAQRILDAFRATQTKTPIAPPVDPDMTAANDKLRAFREQWTTVLTAPPGAIMPGQTTGPAPGGIPMPRFPGQRAFGGLFSKMPTDAVIQPASAGLIQWAEPSTRGEAFIPLGGGERSKQIWAETGRQLFKFEDGGFRAPDVAAATALVGTPYSQGNRNDCSGMVARVISRALGLPEAGLMSTKNAAQWLAQRGFQPGRGGPGTITVGWYDHGPNPNDGHMAMTLSDGTNAESGGSHGTFLIGAGAAGADSPQFDQHMFLPTLYGQGPAGSGGAGGSASGSGGGTAGVGPNGETGSYTPDPAGVAKAEAGVRDADAKVAIQEQKVRELKSDASESQKMQAEEQARKAREDRDEANAKLQEAQRGKFVKSKDGSGSAADGGGQELGEVGSIASQFLKDTLGLGDLFPDPSQLGIVKLAQAVMGIKYTPQGSGFKGGLLAGMPGAAAATQGGGIDLGGGSLPFGMIPGIASKLPTPGAPLGTPASGVGLGQAPGPVDQSTHVTLNNPQGTPEQNEMRVRRVLLKTPRYGTYTQNPGVMGA